MAGCKGRLHECAYVVFKMLALVQAIDNLHISHNASGMGANIQVLLVRISSSHSSLDVNGLELPCLAATMCFTRLRNQMVIRSCAVDAKINLSKTVT